ncbi:MAG: biotin--[acetyl-CoA-carboxylase] ligase [Lautropia sp.]
MPGTGLANAPSRLAIERIDAIDSTNDELLRRPSLTAGGADAVWLVAAQQLRGRGRRQRGWQSTADGSLTASFGRELALAPGTAARLGTLPLVAGIAIAETLADFGVDARLKWPNDLQRAAATGGFAKIGGILCEARGRSAATRIVIGCGLNLRRPHHADTFGQPVAGLFDSLTAAALAAERERLIVALGAALLAATDTLFTAGFAPFRSRWQARDVLAGQPIDVHRDGRVRPALACGIDDDGALLVEYLDAAVGDSAVSGTAAGGAAADGIAAGGTAAGGTASDGSAADGAAPGPPRRRERLLSEEVSVRALPVAPALR